MADERLQVIGCSSSAKLDLKVAEGSSLIGLIFPQDYLGLQKMKPGQISRIKLNVKQSCTVTVVRFFDYFVFRREKEKAAFVSESISIKNDSEKQLKEVDEFCARIGGELFTSDKTILTLRNKQLIRRSNAVDMLDMVSDISLRGRGNFEPAENVAAVVRYANEILDDDGVYISCDAAPSPYCCSGVKSDFYTATAVMIAIAAENSRDGKIYLKSSYSMYRYGIQLSFKSFYADFMGGERVKEQTALINCIAESNGWFLRFVSSGGKESFLLMLPCDEEKTLYLRTPKMVNSERRLVKEQLVGITVAVNRRKKRGEATVPTKNKARR